METPQKVQITPPNILNKKDPKGSQSEHESEQINVSDETNLLNFLYSTETLDRSSPELWPERIPGVNGFASTCDRSPVQTGIEDILKDLESELDKDDMDMLQEFGSLTTAQLMDKVKGLQNLAYQLGLDESREMTRGKYLRVLSRTDWKK